MNTMSIYTMWCFDCAPGRYFRS